MCTENLIRTDASGPNPCCTELHKMLVGAVHFGRALGDASESRTASYRYPASSLLGASVVRSGVYTHSRGRKRRKAPKYNTRTVGPDGRHAMVSWTNGTSLAMNPALESSGGNSTDTGVHRRSSLHPSVSPQSHH